MCGILFEFELIMETVNMTTKRDLKWKRDVTCIFGTSRL